MVKIMIAVDGSAASLEAVRHGIGLLQQGLKAHFVIAHVQKEASLLELATQDSDLIANASIEAVTATFNELQAGKATLIHAQIALDTVRDTLAATEQRFHKQILDVKTQVRAQYGDDSNELAALGLKKKSEKKSPSRRPRRTGTAEG